MLLMQVQKVQSHDIEALSVESAATPQQIKPAPKHSQHRSWEGVWEIAQSNCTWMLALWRDLLCVGFGLQLWKVYVHDLPKVCPSLQPTVASTPPDTVCFLMQCIGDFSAVHMVLSLVCPFHMHLLHE